MSAIVDIVGHFGTEFSYATVASNVAHALEERGLLGVASNLDPKWHPKHKWLADQTMRGRGTHVVLFTPPHHYIDAYSQSYGRDRSAIFMSPNTDTLSDEHALTCSQFSLVLCPSAWCRRVVERAVPEADTAVVPLGVDAELWSQELSDARFNRLSEGEKPVLLHLSSDQFWPGRKGTEELLKAWSISSARDVATLLLHVPPALLVPATYLLRHLDLEDSVEVISGELRGGASSMRNLFGRADLLVAPSRCEGFGIMLLSAIYAGLPLLSTFNTGHADFLAQAPGGWFGVPTRDAGPLPGETGQAPIVEPEALAASLNVAVAQHALLRLMWTNSWRGDEALTWSPRAREWARVIERWTTEEAC
jgi:glycosyltransferase involved in cell wall biosynthesis